MKTCKFIYGKTKWYEYIQLETENFWSYEKSNIFLLWFFFFLAKFCGNQVFYNKFEVSGSGEKKLITQEVANLSQGCESRTN